MAQSSNSQFSFKVPKKKKDESANGIFSKSNFKNPFSQTSTVTNPFRLTNSKPSSDEETKSAFSLEPKDTSAAITNPYAGNTKPSFLLSVAGQTNENPSVITKNQKRPFSKESAFSSKPRQNPFSKFNVSKSSQRSQTSTLGKPSVLNKWIAPAIEKNERQRSSSPYREKNGSSDASPQRSRFMDRIEKQAKDAQNTSNPFSKAPLLQEQGPPQMKKQHAPDVKNQFNASKLNSTSAVTREMTAIINALVELQGRPCPDDYTRYMVLDERDKLLYRWRTEMDKNSPRVGKKVKTGSLNSMCAEKERYIRAVQKRIASYECDKNGELDASRLIKEYSRSAAVQEKPLPHELRKPEMLRYTMNYLLTNILDFFDPSSEEVGGWYNFLWDRTRAIRKEITQLMLSNELAVALLESCTRFHIICAYLLCYEDLDKFDQKMNTENLGDSLQTLRHLYEDLAKKGIYCSSEAEFRAYDVLLHLQDSNVLRQVLSYRKEVREDKSVRLSIQLASAMQTNNFTKFFRLLRNEATYLQCCICHRFFTQVRSKALAVMARSYGRNPTFNIQHLSLILAFDDEKNALDIMGEYGIYPNDNTEEVDFTREHLNTDAVPQMVTYKWIDAKNTCRLSETVNGGPVNVCREVPEILDSFDTNGYYTQDTVLNELLKPYVNLEKEVMFPHPQIEAAISFDETLARQKAAEEEKRKLEEEQIQKAHEQERQHRQRQAEEEIRKQKELERLQKIEEERLIELEKKRQEDLRKQELCRNINLALPTLYEKIATEAVNHLLKFSIKEMISSTRKERERCRIFAERTSHCLIKSITDEELKRVVKIAIESRRREVKMTLSKIKTRLSLLWLKQFWDQWRAYVEDKKATRRRRSAAWEEFRPSWNSSSFSPNLYLNGSGQTTKDNRLSLDTTQRLALAQFKRKRIERISRWAFEQWRLYAQKKSLKRKQADILVIQSTSFISRRSKAATKNNDVSKLKRVSYFNGNSPIRKSAKLTLEESFSFPTIKTNASLDEGMGNSYERSFMETSVITEEDMAIARKELDRSSYIWAKKDKSDIMPPVQDDALKENKNKTIELVDDCRQGQQRFHNLKNQATGLAESIREHQSLMNSLLDSVINKRNSLLENN